jgi:plastocyanin
MIWRWLTSFSALATLAAGSGVGGRVEVQDARGAAASPAGAVVWLLSADGRKLNVSPREARMVQRDKQFHPHVLAVPVGSVVEFPNLDPVFHNAFSNIEGQPFDIGLYPPGTSRKVLFHRPGVVRIFCNIHASMSAVVVVVDTRLVAVVGSDGRFQFDRVEPGRYRLKVFYERSSNETLDALTRDFDVGSRDVELAPLKVTATGYIEVPHKNKYGQDYPPESPGYATREGRP